LKYTNNFLKILTSVSLVASGRSSRKRDLESNAFRFEGEETFEEEEDSASMQDLLEAAGTSSV